MMVIPTTRKAIFDFLGLIEDKPVYNGFEPFVPFVPGYFPDDFEITHVGHSESLSEDVNVYSEIYATDTHFFKTIQQQGKGVPDSIPESGFTIQGSPAILEETHPENWLRDTESDNTRFDLDNGWLVTFIIKEIHIQVVTNLPEDEAVLIAEGLIPAICTTRPTETPSN